MVHDQPSARTSPDPDAIVTARDFGRELTLAKESAGLTVRELADKASVPTSTVQGYLSGEHLPQPTYLEPFKRILAVCGEGSEATVRKWLDALTRARRAPGRRPSTARNPYRGLVSFEQEDAAWFHGREQLTGEIVRRIVRRAATGGGPLIVTGPSGAGKSSLLRAGVLPSLHERGYDGILLTPGMHPLDELEAAVAAGSEASATSETVRVLVVDQFEAVFAREISDEDRHSFINALCRPRASGTRDRTGAVVVLGIRVDFYPQALRHPLLAAAVHTDQAVVEPMTATELRRVITEPARQAKLDVEPGLVDLVLHDLAPRTSGFTSGGIHDAGALPLLSHALAAAWERHRAGKLTIADYLAVGGITGSIAQTADAVFAALTPQQQRAARRLFLRLVRTEDDSADTRRRVPLSHVSAGDDDAEAQADREVLDRFIAARLITAGDDTVEITHEALLTAWPQLVDWLDGDRDWRRRHHRLKRSAEQWYEANEDPDLLVRGGTLQIALEWVEDRDHRGDVGVLDRKFVEASIRHQAEEEVRERRQVRRRYRFAALLAVLAVIAGSIGVFARQQQVTREREQTQALSRQVASEADVLRDHKVSVSMQLALAAYRISPTPEALSSLLNSTGVTPQTRLRPSSGADAETIAVSGNLLAMGTDTGQVQLWSLTGKGGTPLGAPLSGSGAAILAVAFDRDGGLLAAAGKDGNVHLWNTRNPAQPVALGTVAGTGASIDSVALSADGQRLAAGNGDGRTLLWNIVDPSHPLPAPELIGPTLSVTSVAFSPDGRILTAGSDDDTVHLWQVADTAHPVALSSVNTPNSRVFAVAVSPDGRKLAAGTAADHDVHLWDIADPTHPIPSGLPLTGPASWVNSVAFSPDGRTLAAGSSDGLLWMFDLDTGQPLRKLPHPGPITTVDYRDDGTVVSSTVDDGAVYWWRLPGPIIVGAKDSIFNVGFADTGDKVGLNPGAGDNTLTMWNVTDIHHPAEMGPPITGNPGPGRFAGSGALSADGRLFVAGDVDGTVRLFDVSDPEHPASYGPPFPAAKALIESVPISPKGDLLAAGSDDGKVHLIGISDPRRPHTLATVSAPTSGNVYQAVFSPDERLMAAYSDNHNAYLYDISQPTRPVLLATLSGFTSAAYSAAFNANGHLVAVGSAQGTARVWDITDPKHPISVGQQLAGPIGYIYALSFAPSKDVLAMSGSSASAIWLWDLSDPHHAVHLATLDGPASGAFAVTFSPDGEVLAAGGVDHTAQFWDTSPGTAATWICSVVGEPITKAEWDQYVPGRPYAPLCS